MFFLILFILLYLFAFMILFVKDKNGESLWILFYKENIELAIFHFVISAICGIVLFRTVNDTMINRFNMFFLGNGIAFIILFFLHICFVKRIPRVILVVFNVIICASVVFGLSKTGFTKYSRNIEQSDTAVAAHSCYICGEDAYSQYGSHYYCPEHYAMVKTVDEAD